MTHRNILTGFYVIYAIAIVFLLVIPNHALPDFYKPGFMAGISLLSMLLVALPGWIFTATDEKRKKILLSSQVVIAFSVFINGAGGLGLYKLYKIGIPYDKIMHVIVPLMLVYVAVVFAHHWYGVSVTHAIIYAAVAIFLLCVGWEGWEVLQDSLFGTKTAGVYGEDYWNDTTLDILSDAIGIAFGSLLAQRRAHVVERIG